MSSSNENFMAYKLQTPQMKSNNISEGSASYEVFRNTTTAVEVIVKEVPRSNSRTKKFDHQDDTLNNRLKDDVDRLQKKLNIANETLERSRNSFKICYQEMKKQLESSYQREADITSRNLMLQLENEKIKAYLDSKTNLVTKLKKELTSVRKIMKFIGKRLSYIPQQDLTGLSYVSDPGYDDFERNLKRELKMKMATFEESATDDDSSLSKNFKNTFDKSATA